MDRGLALRLHIALVAGVFCAVFTARTQAAPLVTDAPGNARWNATDDKNLAFLGGDQKETALLLVRKPLFLGATLTIKSDATSVTLFSGNSTKLSIPMAADGLTIALDPGAPPHQLTVNGNQSASVAAKWRQIASNSDSVLSLQFDQLTFATISYDPPANLPPETSTSLAPAPSPPATPATPASAPAPTDPKQIAARSVVLIQDLDAEHRPFQAGSGFILSEDGFVVTNFHLIQGAAGAQALRGSEKDKPVPLELWAVEPDQDLALLKLVPKQPETYEPIPVGPLPAETSAVWALGASAAGRSATRCIVSKVLTFSDLDPKLRESFAALGAQTRWIQTDGGIDAADSGGPLINQRGQVVGINTWLWSDHQNACVALSAGHLGQLMRRRGQPPLTFAALQSPSMATNLVPTPWSMIPRALAGRELLHETSSTQTAGAIKALASGIRKTCAHCNGSGKVTVESPSGRQFINGVWRTVYNTETSTCERCKGTGFERANDDAISRLAGNLIRTLTLLNPTDPALTESSAQVVDAINQYVIRDDRTLTTVVARTKQALSAKSAEPGTPVFSKVLIRQVLPVNAKDRELLVELDGSHELALVTGTPTEDAHEGSTAYLAGVVCSAAMSPTHAPESIIRAGVLLPAN